MMMMIASLLLYWWLFCVCESPKDWILLKTSDSMDDWRWCSHPLFYLRWITWCLTLSIPDSWLKQACFSNRLSAVLPSWPQIWEW